MKPILEHLPREAEESFVVKHFDYYYYPTPWHFHPEYELVLVTESTGKRFIGDRVTKFGPGDLALIGPNLPHLYRNDPQYYNENPSLRARSIVVHFREESFGHHFLDLPEARKLQLLLTKSERGLQISGETNRTVSEILFQLIELNGLPRWLKLVEILQILCESNHCEYISTHAINGKSELESSRLNKVMEHISLFFAEEIYLSDMASLVGMTESSFSRYFKQRTRKTFVSFLAEIRLNHACKLLVEGRESITEICYQCGFNNLSNFNRQFVKTYQVNPLTYRRQYWNKL